MLFKKMLRDIRSNFAQFFSIFILSVVAMWCFTGLQANVIGGTSARNKFNEKSNFANGWIYSGGFDNEQLDKVKSIDKVKSAQLRTEVLGKAEEEYNSAEIYCYFQDQASVTVPYTMSGSDYDPDDSDGIWLFYRFADAWKLEIGRKFKVNVMGQEIEKEIKGFIHTPEYEYVCATSDTDTDYHNIGFAYLSTKAIPKDMQVFNEIIYTCDGDPLKLESDISEALDEKYSFIADRKSIRGYNQLTDELNQHDSFSYIYSFVFLSIAILVIVTTMKRMIAHQRVQIGTMNALGMKKRKIMLHYLSYSFVISAVGAALGVFLGVKTLGAMMVKIFGGTAYSVPDWKPGFNYKSFVFAAVIVMICTASSYLSCKQILKIQPSEALRPAYAPNARKCIFEKLFFWNKLGFNTRYNLRDISRSKMRSFMGIFGTCAGMLLMSLGLGSYDTVDNVRSWYFSNIQNYSYQVILKDNCDLTDAETLENEKNGELISMSSISIAADPHPVSDDIISASLAVTEGKQLYCISDTDLNARKLEKGTVALTMKQAAKLGLSEGDNVYWKRTSDNEWNVNKIGFISRHPSIMGITMLREDYEAAGFEFSPYLFVSNEDCSDIENRSFVSAVHSMEDLKAAFDSNMEIMNLLVYVMIAFSVLLIIIVLYNSGNLSFNEREKEFATLKVMGFRSSSIRRLLSTQNLWLSVIGVICGLPLGRAALQAMMDSNGDSVDWPCVVYPLSYILSAIFVMAISLLVGFMFAKRIKRIDMVEVLKGME